MIHKIVGWRNGKRSQVGIVKEELTSISTLLVVIPYRFESCPDYLKLKIMKKTYNNGVLVGTIITSIIYSILLFVIVYNLTH